MTELSGLVEVAGKTQDDNTKANAKGIVERNQGILQSKDLLVDAKKNEA